MSFTDMAKEGEAFAVFLLIKLRRIIPCVW